MQEELATTTSAAAAADTTAADRPTRRRSPRALWRSLDWDRRTNILSFVCAVAIVGALYGSAFAATAVWKHNGRTQAVHRARKMDGRVYTIKGVSWNWVGDTRLFLENERGEPAGWVMIHTNNPLTNEVNPLYLSLSDKRHEPLPFPMKVRVRFRPEAWADRHAAHTKENFTGSFLEFERLD